ncbi:MAG: tetratricopeptide repeat protein [bacterium]|nr:tetratricopeptide repeat protein [bacterium]
MSKRAGLTFAVVLVALASNASAVRADTWKEATTAFAKKEYARAAKLFKPLAEKGNALAQYRIAKMHQMGLGVSKDARQAKKWGQLSAKQGNAEAAALMGSLYYKADGGEAADVVRAYAWYDVSAEQGNAEAKKEIAVIAKDMTPAQLSEAREKAQKCKTSKLEQCD